MNKNLEKTVVVFRKFKTDGTIVALFPFELTDENGNVSSYMHVGQHSAADYSLVMKQTVAPTLEESSALKTELEGLGYNLLVKRRARQSKKTLGIPTVETTEHVA